MSKTSSENASLRRDLKKRDHQIALLQQENHRLWALVPKGYINLMGVYPPLRKLLHVLAEAADAQDPTRGAPTEDTMRTEVTELTPVERGVLSHWRARNNVRFISKELDILARDFTKKLADKTAHFASVTSATEWEYELPPPPVCHRKGCSLRGRQQAYEAWKQGCGGCGRSFEKEAANG
jgi:hypothetical protein